MLNNKRGFFEEDLFKIIWVILLLSIMLTPVISLFKASVEVKVYNSKYNTHYTPFEFLFARDTILDYTGEGKQQKINLKVENK
jgi:hypothetical protein